MSGIPCFSGGCGRSFYASCLAGSSFCYVERSCLKPGACRAPTGRGCLRRTPQISPQSLWPSPSLSDRQRRLSHQQIVTSEKDRAWRLPHVEVPPHPSPVVSEELVSAPIKGKWPLFHACHSTHRLLIKQTAKKQILCV